jgi:dTDP-glucose pyrophosphorylase
MADNFFNYINIKQADGAILTFIDDDAKWSFVKLNKNSNIISEVAEKKQISNIASVGIYYWKHGSDFVNSAEQMIEQNIRVNNEFYIAPTYNILINDNKKIYNYPIAEMHGLGTPEDLNRFLQLGIKC